MDYLEERQSPIKIIEQNLSLAMWAMEGKENIASLALCQNP